MNVILTQKFEWMWCAKNTLERIIPFENSLSIHTTKKSSQYVKAHWHTTFLALCDSSTMDKKEFRIILSNVWRKAQQKFYVKFSIAQHARHKKKIQHMVNKKQIQRYTGYWSCAFVVLVSDCHAFFFLLHFKLLHSFYHGL